MTTKQKQSQTEARMDRSALIYADVDFFSIDWLNEIEKKCGEKFVISSNDRRRVLRTVVGRLNGLMHAYLYFELYRRSGVSKYRESKPSGQISSLKNLKQMVTEAKFTTQSLLNQLLVLTDQNRIRFLYSVFAIKSERGFRQTLRDTKSIYKRLLILNWHLDKFLCSLNKRKDISKMASLLNQTHLFRELIPIYRKLYGRAPTKSPIGSRSAPPSQKFFQCVSEKMEVPFSKQAYRKFLERRKSKKHPKS